MRREQRRLVHGEEGEKARRGKQSENESCEQRKAEPSPRENDTSCRGMRA